MSTACHNAQSEVYMDQNEKRMQKVYVRLKPNARQMWSSDGSLHDIAVSPNMSTKKKHQVFWLLQKVAHHFWQHTDDPICKIVWYIVPSAPESLVFSFIFWFQIHKMYYARECFNMISCNPMTIVICRYWFRMVQLDLKNINSEGYVWW